MDMSIPCSSISSETLFVSSAAARIRSKGRDRPSDRRIPTDRPVDTPDDRVDRIDRIDRITGAVPTSYVLDEREALVKAAGVVVVGVTIIVVGNSCETFPSE